MDASSLEELSSHFEEKLSRLTATLAIESSLNHSDNDVKAESQQSMESVWCELDDLSVILTLMRTHMAEQQQVLSGVQDVKRKLAVLVEGLQHAHNNLPPHLPSVHAAPATTTTTSPMEAEKENFVKSTAAPVHHEKIQAGVNAKSLPAKSMPPQQSVASPCPLIEYLTVDEFGDVPKYMKGRLTYQQVNTFIDEMNKACKSKYKLLRQKKSTLNDANRKRFETLKMQESKDTAGAYFVTESDLQEWSNVKLSKENRSILTVLRHCGRMYEIRSGSLVRYAVVDLY